MLRITLIFLPRPSELKKYAKLEYRPLSHSLHQAEYCTESVNPLITAFSPQMSISTFLDPFKPCIAAHLREEFFVLRRQNFITQRSTYTDRIGALWSSGRHLASGSEGFESWFESWLCQDDVEYLGKALYMHFLTPLMCKTSTRP